LASGAIAVTAPGVRAAIGGAVPAPHPASITTAEMPNAGPQ
jgi:hypothetical protein